MLTCQYSHAYISIGEILPCLLPCLNLNRSNPSMLTCQYSHAYISIGAILQTQLLKPRILTMNASYESIEQGQPKRRRVSCSNIEL